MNINKYILSLLLVLIGFSCANRKGNHFAIYTGEVTQKTKIDSFILEKPFDYTAQVMNKVDVGVINSIALQIDTSNLPHDSVVVFSNVHHVFVEKNRFDSVAEVKQINPVNIDSLKRELKVENKQIELANQSDSVLQVNEIKVSTIDSVQKELSIDKVKVDSLTNTMISMDTVLLKTETVSKETNLSNRLDSLSTPMKSKIESDSLNKNENVENVMKAESSIIKVAPTESKVKVDTIYIQQIIYKVDTIIKWKETPSLKSNKAAEIIPVPIPVSSKKQSDTLKVIIRDTVYIKEVIRQTDTVVKWQNNVINNKEVMRLQPETYIMYYKMNQLLPKDLNKVIDELKNKVKPPTQVQISSYTDSGGSAKYNQSIALKRSLLIKEQLIKAGFDAKIIFVQAFGEQFAQSIQNEKDRKTEIKIIY